MNKFIYIILIASLTFGCSLKKKEKATKNYEPNWESLAEYEIPKWFADAKFGIFIHWGPYCVPEFGSEWYPRLMYVDSVAYAPTGEVYHNGPSWVYKHHIKNYGHPGEFGYKDFIPMFTGENFNPDNWMELFKKAGAKYVVPVAEHHDGFAMYNSNVTRWNAVKMGPKKDVIAEIKKAAEKYDLHFGVSSHFAFNWDYYNKKKGFDTANPEFSDLYGKAKTPFEPANAEFLDLWWNRTKDIVDNYQPEILWFDFFMDKPEWTPYHPKLAAYFYNKGQEWNKDVVLQTKNAGFTSYPSGTNVLDIERGKLSDITKNVWQTDTSIGKNSWGYVKNWQSKTPNVLIDDLIDIVSKNGCLLLNVGPKKDGTIPQDQADVLLEIGDWLKTNGEAIYGTHPWELFGEGPTIVKNGHHSEKKNQEFGSEDIRFTHNKKTLYVHILDIPSSNKIVVKSLVDHKTINEKSIRSIELLGENAKPDWHFSKKGLEISLNEPLSAKHALVVKIRYKS